jgi:hypothetical protein
MEVVSGKAAIHELDPGDLDDAVAQLRLEAGGFSVQYDLSHRAALLKTMP